MNYDCGGLTICIETKHAAGDPAANIEFQRNAQCSQITGLANEKIKKSCNVQNTHSQD